MAQAQDFPVSVGEADQARHAANAIVEGVATGAGLSAPIWVMRIESAIGLGIAALVLVYWVFRVGCVIRDFRRKGGGVP